MAEKQEDKAENTAVEVVKDEAKATTEEVVTATEEPKTASTAKKKLSKKWLAGIIVAVLILVIGGGAGAYFGVVKPNQPKNVVKKALSNALVLNQQRSFNITAEFEAKDSDTDLEFNELTIEGGFDANSNMRADVGIDASGFNINASAIMRLEDQNMFLKLDNLDSMFAAIPDAMSNPDVANFVNTLSDNWIRISAADLEELGMITASQSEKASQCIDEISSFIKNSGADLQKQFDSIYENADFATMKKIAGEVINGQKATKYAVSIDEAKFRVFIKNLGNQLKGSTKDVADKCGFSEATDSLDEDASSESDTNLGNLFVWIDSKKQISQLEVNMSDDEMNIKLTATMSNNKVDTEEPGDFTTIADLLADETFTTMFGSFFGGLTGSDSSSSSSDYDYSDYTDYSDYYGDLEDMDPETMQLYQDYLNSL